MKIQGPGRTQETSKTGKKSKVSGGSGSFADHLATEGASGAAGARHTQSIAQMDALLALQGAEDPAQRKARKHMRARADAILNSLEEIRMAMLTGGLTVGHMIGVADVIASHREKITDPALSGLMDEVDLRAQVELAKMRFALDRRKPS